MYEVALLFYSCFFINLKEEKVRQTAILTMFILIAANNMAPCTPVEHIVGLYDAAKEFGCYDAG